MAISVLLLLIATILFFVAAFVPTVRSVHLGWMAAGVLSCALVLRSGILT